LITGGMLMQIDQIANAISNRYMDSLFGVTELAYELNMSESNLREIVCMNFGMSPQKLIETVRLEKTIKLISIDSKQYSIAKIVGYASTRSFRRAFQKRIGMSPSKYKNILFNNNQQTYKIVQDTILGLWNNV
jgi:AraC-like DNA-binding protein